MKSKLLSDHSLFSSLLPWLGGAFLLGLVYLAVAAWGFGFSGFPLDDAWIHQTYARNLAQSGQLAFIPGVPSAGSTAPLWSLLLSLGYLLGVPYPIWTHSLGLIFLGLTGWSAARLGSYFFPERPEIGRWAGLFCLMEWHLLWAAVSGMETIMFVWLSLGLVERYTRSKTSKARPGSKFREDFGLGLWAGLLILTRPEGLGLLGLIGLDKIYQGWQARKAGEINGNWVLSSFLGLVGGVSLLLMPYVIFHLWQTGLPFPNTFYAKQAEYAVILAKIPLWWRLFGNFAQPIETVQGVFQVVFIGAQLLLLPGLLFGAWLTLKERRTDLWLIWLWWVGFLLLYAFRLPVTYQHGRYQIPAISWIILLGLWGTARLLQSVPPDSLALRVVSRAGVLSLGLLLLAFVGIGAGAYARDVRFIETEMVATARWINTHTPAQALIAAHDIGALGYFGQRPLIDLAGLITPEIIPIIRDEAALLHFITNRQADYLVTFPSWYPAITQNPRLTPLYTTGAAWSVQAGSDNMTVYRINQ